MLRSSVWCFYFNTIQLGLISSMLTVFIGSQLAGIIKISRVIRVQKEVMFILFGELKCLGYVFGTNQM